MILKYILARKLPDAVKHIVDTAHWMTSYHHYIINPQEIFQLTTTNYN